MGYKLPSVAARAIRLGGVGGLLGKPLASRRGIMATTESAAAAQENIQAVARLEANAVVEVSVGRAPLDRVLGRAFNNNPIEQTRLLRREKFCYLTP